MVHVGIEKQRDEDEDDAGGDGGDDDLRGVRPLLRGLRLDVTARVLKKRF